jgi:NodT family efflux transporter outer membrane factor (OMF) lipoprotein
MPEKGSLSAFGWRVMLMGIPLALISCESTGSNGQLHPTAEIPAVWKNNAALSGEKLDTAALPTWWTRFNDPVLDELMAGALHSSPDVRSALSRITEYRARRGIEGAALFPSLDAKVSGGSTRTTNRDTNHTTTNTPYAASLDASWQVDLFGRQRQTLAAASADLAQTEENYYGAQVSLAASVASAYVTLRSTEAQLTVVQHSLGTRGETAQLTQWREQAGTGNALDTQQALATLELARASIPALQLAIDQTRNQLALLSGGTPGSLDGLLAPPHGVPDAPPALAIGIPAEMLRQRPDVRAAERGLAAAFARTNAARRQRLPSLTLSGSIGVEALSAGRIFNPAATVVSILGGLSAPIFNAGRIRQTITIQNELEKQALNTYESAILTALGEVENALVAVRQNSERLAILARATAAARESATLSALQYQSGQVDLLVSLDAQRTLLDLEQQSVVTAANRANAYVQLYQSLGGGWTHL